MIKDYDDLPTKEPITTHVHLQRERHKRMKSRMRKGFCAKQSYTRKQGLTQMNLVNKIRYNSQPHVRIYKCPRCDRWHLTSKPERKKLSTFDTGGGAVYNTGRIIK